MLTEPAKGLQGMPLPAQAALGVRVQRVNTARQAPGQSKPAMWFPIASKELQRCAESDVIFLFREDPLLSLFLTKPCPSRGRSLSFLHTSYKVTPSRMGKLKARPLVWARSLNKTHPWIAGWPRAGVRPDHSEVSWRMKVGLLACWTRPSSDTTSLGPLTLRIPLPVFSGNMVSTERSSWLWLLQ